MRPVGSSMALGTAFGIAIIGRADWAFRGTGRRELPFLVRVDNAILAHEGIYGAVDESSSIDVEGALWRGIEYVVLILLLPDKRLVRGVMRYVLKSSIPWDHHRVSGLPC